MKIALMTSLKDKEGIRLVGEITTKIKSGFIPQTKIVYIFCDRPAAKNLNLDFGDIPIIFESSGKLRKSITDNPNGVQVEMDRMEYDKKVYHQLAGYKPDVVLLVGYMLKTSAWLCEKLPMLNLHPDVPKGFVGTWQEVMQQIVGEKRKFAGAMIHCVSPQLDKGQPLTYCQFSLGDSAYANLWNNPQMEQKLKEKIREEEFKRELPFLFLTLRALATSEISFKNNQTIDLSNEVEKYLVQYP